MRSWLQATTNYSCLYCIVTPHSRAFRFCKGSSANELLKGVSVYRLLQRLSKNQLTWNVLQEIRKSLPVQALGPHVFSGFCSKWGCCEGYDQLTWKCTPSQKVYYNIMPVCKEQNTRIYYACMSSLQCLCNANAPHRHFQIMMAAAERLLHMFKDCVTYAIKLRIQPLNPLSQHFVHLWTV